MDYWYYYYDLRHVGFQQIFSSKKKGNYQLTETLMLTKHLICYTSKLTATDTIMFNYLKHSLFLELSLWMISLPCHFLHLNTPVNENGTFLEE